MEEVDSIILHFLRQLHINIKDDVKNICDLPVEIIIEAVSKCLTAINQSLKVPSVLPSGISHRIEVAAQLASLCKDLGYKNDVGYQTFLYYNEAELRQVFMFLIERLPTDGKTTNVNTEFTNKKSLLLRDISSKIAEELNSMWIPPCCNSSSQTIGDSLHFKGKQPQTSEIQLSNEEMRQKLLKIKEINNKPVLTEDKNNVGIFENKPAIARQNKCDVNKNIKELKEILITLRQKLDAYESEKNVMNVEYSQAKKLCEKVEADYNNVQNILSSIGITDFESEKILDKVQRDIDTMHKNSEELTSNNIFYKIEIDKLRRNKPLSESERSKCKRILLNLKEAAKQMKEDYENKEELKNQLMKSYEKLKGENKRSIYTKRILEIISNVEKQNMEIKKILEDTRLLQKEINNLEGQLDRCFSIADETLFKDAKKDDQAKKAYKLLALLHSECNTIVSLVNDTGILARDIVDLEDNIKTEKAKRTEDTLKKMQLDLTKMLEELGKTH